LRMRSLLSTHFPPKLFLYLFIHRCTIRILPSAIDDNFQNQPNDPDELPMRPGEGRVGTGFCSASTPYFSLQQKP
jgi:hypothetical protein